MSSVGCVTGKALSSEKVGVPGGMGVLLFSLSVAQDPLFLAL